MSVEFCGLTLASPVINGSGTFDAVAALQAFGEGLGEAFPFSAYVSKTITLDPRAGNPPPPTGKRPRDTAEVAACGKSAQEGGADAVSLINTLRALARAPEPGRRCRRAWLGGGSGGLSGPAVRAVALAQVAAVASQVSIPV